MVDREEQRKLPDWALIAMAVLGFWGLVALVFILPLPAFVKIAVGIGVYVLIRYELWSTR